jgi:hypothetical protein
LEGVRFDIHVSRFAGDGVELVESGAARAAVFARALRSWR